MRITLPRLLPLAALALPVVSFSQTRPQETPCTAYFGVLQDDAKAPGGYVARMSSSQADWYAKSGTKNYPGLCLSLEKARYLIVWTVATQARTIQTTAARTATETTSTAGQESGTFSAYGSLSTWGRYSGTSSSSSASTISYQESVPVTITADRCSLYVLKSVGPTVWDDISSKTPQPFAIFSADTSSPGRTSGGDQTGTAVANLRSLVIRAASRDLTVRALDATLKFIFTQPTEAAPVQPPPPPASVEIVTSTVSMNSTPQGADIAVDGKFSGSTPSMLRVASGDHQVEMTKPGFKPWKRTLTVSPGGQVTIDATLEKVPTQ